MTPVFDEIETHLGFIEGPVVVGDDELLGVSLSAGCVFRIERGRVSIVAKLPGAPNGSTLDGDGVIFVAQNGGHCPGLPRRTANGGIQTITPDKTVGWLTTDPVAPNDLCFGPDGLLYITDPTRQAARDDGRLWRADPHTGESELETSVPWFPNGIAFGVNGDDLYVTSTGDRRIYRFDRRDIRSASAELVVELTAGHPDGMAVDVDGNLVVAAVGGEGEAGGIHVISPTGVLLELVNTGPSRYITNVALTPDRRLFATDADRGVVMCTDWPTAGLDVFPFRSVIETPLEPRLAKVSTSDGTRSE